MNEKLASNLHIEEENLHIYENCFKFDDTLTLRPLNRSLESLDSYEQ